MNAIVECLECTEQKHQILEYLDCDLLIAVGTRFSDRVLGNPKTFAKNAKILQIDVDPVEINKNICVSASIIGDVKAVLTVINRRLEAQEHKEWLDTGQRI